MGRAVRQAVTFFGVDILTDRRRFQAGIGDLLPGAGYRVERETLLFAIRMDIGRAILEGDGQSVLEKRRWIERVFHTMVEEMGLNAARSRAVAHALAVGLAWPREAFPAAEPEQDPALGKNSGQASGRAPVRVGEMVAFGPYQWRVLDVERERILLLLETIADVGAPYDARGCAVSWAECSLRSWLNERFYGRFEKREQDAILPSLLSARENPRYGTPAGPETTDRCFLLSISEAVYFFRPGGARRGRGADAPFFVTGDEEMIDDSFSERRQASYHGQKVWWWLRSPGEEADKAAFVNAKGQIILSGEYVFDDGGSVAAACRPAVRCAVYVRPSYFDRL